MLTLLTSYSSLFYYKKLAADVGAGSALSIINDQHTLLLNVVVIVGRIVLELIHRRRAAKAKGKEQQIENEKF